MSNIKFAPIEKAHTTVAAVRPSIFKFKNENDALDVFKALREIRKAGKAVRKSSGVPYYAGKAIRGTSTTYTRYVGDGFIILFADDYLSFMFTGKDFDSNIGAEEIYESNRNYFFHHEEKMLNDAAAKVEKIRVETDRRRKLFNSVKNDLIKAINQVNKQKKK
jgi:hypothetical protein